MRVMDVWFKTISFRKENGEFCYFTSGLSNIQQGLYNKTNTRSTNKNTGEKRSQKIKQNTKRALCSDKGKKNEGDDPAPGAPKCLGACHTTCISTRYVVFIFPISCIIIFFIFGWRGETERLFLQLKSKDLNLYRCIVAIHSSFNASLFSSLSHAGADCNAVVTRRVRGDAFWFAWWTCTIVFIELTIKQLPRKRRDKSNGIGQGGFIVQYGVQSNWADMLLLQRQARWNLDRYKYSSLYCSYV